MSGTLCPKCHYLCMPYSIYSFMFECPNCKGLYTNFSKDAEKRGELNEQTIREM